MNWLSPLENITSTKRQGNYFGRNSYTDSRELNKRILELKETMNGKEIANFLGISCTTVSKHINGKIKCVSAS